MADDLTRLMEQVARQEARLADLATLHAECEPARLMEVRQAGQEYRRRIAAEQERDDARQWSALWKSSAKKSRGRELALLVALCEMQGAYNVAAFERDGALAMLSKLADFACNEGGWRLFYYANEPPPEGVFDLSDTFNPDVASGADLADRAREVGAAVANLLRVDYGARTGAVLKHSDVRAVLDAVSELRRVVRRAAGVTSNDADTGTITGVRE